MLNKNEQNEILKLILPLVAAVDDHLDTLSEDEPSNVTGMQALQRVRRDLKSYQSTVEKELMNPKSNWQYEETLSDVRKALEEFEERMEGVLGM